MTVRCVYSVVRIALDREVKAGRVTARLRPDRPAAARGYRDHAPDETHALIDALAESPHECLIVTSLATGLRESEDCGL